MRAYGVVRDQGWLSVRENGRRSMERTEPEVLLALAKAIGVERDELLYVMGFLDDADMEVRDEEERLRHALSELGSVVQDDEAMRVINEMVMVLRARKRGDAVE